jgi:hypothetical protein
MVLRFLVHFYYIVKIIFFSSSSFRTLIEISELFLLLLGFITYDIFLDLLQKRRGIDLIILRIALFFLFLELLPIIPGQISLIMRH